jgi:hypothetical protein
MRRAFSRTLGLAVLAMLAPAMPAEAWKPYTHNTSAEAAYLDATDDGFVGVLGRSYPVPANVVTALRNWPQFYNAGVIGPDGFPDLTYGQSVIHPSQTGAWLRHVLHRAQLAQNDPAYSAAEKQQILAFSYGFLTHAAGDLWGHTFVNDFARGVFPGVSEILTDAERAAIAVRHIVVEGYIGDATPGYDGFQDDPDDPTRPRAPAPGPQCPPGDPLCDVSDDSTPGFPYDAPHRFIYRTLIDPAAATPSSDRGPLIDLFLLLRSGLEAIIAVEPPPISSAISAYDDTVAALMEITEDCNFGHGLSGLDAVADIAHDLIFCPIALARFGFQVVIDTFEAFLLFAADAILTAADAVLDAYLGYWRDNITEGLQNWSQLGLFSTRGLFDAQERRALQNDECGLQGPDDTSSLLRALCEGGVDKLQVILDSVDPFINDFLLSMLGAPDFVGDLREILGTIQDAIDNIVDTLLAPLNPVREVFAQIKLFARNLLSDAISEVLGVDIDSLQSFLTKPSRWVCLDSTDFTFPILGTRTIELFPGGEHDRLDGLLGVGAEHHVSEQGVALDCGRLTDATEIAFAGVPALHNTVLTAKLLLLDSAEMNRVLGDVLGRTIASYQAGQNLMINALTQADDWLLSIDSDHAWRRDGLPRFCNEGGPCPGDAEPRPVELNGGAGTFPLWESCVLRPSFRALYSDWEGGGFPDLEDDVSADDANDPQAPVSALDRTGTFFSDGTRDFVAADNAFSVSAHDAPAGFAFRDDQLGLRRRVYLDPGDPGPWLSALQNETFSLAGPDAAYHVDVQSADECHRFDGLPSPAEPVQTRTFFLDTTAPVVACHTPPFGLEFDTDDTTTVDFSISDGSIGSGILGQTSTVDGFQGLPGVVPTQDGAGLDLFFFYPGTRTVTVSAADNLGNAGVTTCSFDLHATAQSLMSNVQRAFVLGLIDGPGITTSLRGKLQDAHRMHQRGQHATEHNVLQAFVNELLALRGQNVDAATADRFIAYAVDLIALGR